jgi:hypothetical protein
LKGRPEEEAAFFYFYLVGFAGFPLKAAHFTSPIRLKLAFDRIVLLDSSFEFVSDRASIALADDAEHHLIPIDPAVANLVFVVVESLRAGERSAALFQIQSGFHRRAVGALE